MHHPGPNKLRELPVPSELRVPREQRVSLDLRDLPVLLVLRAPRAPRALQVLQVLQVLRMPQVLAELPESAKEWPVACGCWLV